MHRVAYSDVHINDRQIRLLDFVNDHDMSSFQHAHQAGGIGLARQSTQDRFGLASQTHVPQRSVRQRHHLDADFIAPGFCLALQEPASLKTVQDVGGRAGGHFHAAADRCVRKPP